MQMTSRFVGTPLTGLVRRLDWRQSMNYAAAVGDDNPRYFDDENPEGVIASPMLSVALTWPLVERMAESITAPDFPREALASLVHYTEHLQFHRPIRPEGSLSIDGSIAAICPHRAGTHIVIRFEGHDDSGAPVFTEHLGGMLRGVDCADAGAGVAGLPVVPALGNSGPEPVWEKAIAIDRLRPFLYDGCTGIVFPIHTSRKFARRVGLPDIILQGTATLAFAAAELTRREAGGDPTRLKSLGCRFGGMVFPGTEIRLRLLHQRSDDAGSDLHFEVFNHLGQPAIRNGYARLERSPA
ncbi:MAG: MaoC/PaaZ C-terminal domain-containing protein [Desulfobacterales bacterium]